MSEHRLSRLDDGERTARVWQPSDFFHLGPEGGFVAKRWRDDAALRFQRSDTPTVIRPAPRLDAEASSPAAPALREAPVAAPEADSAQPAEADPDRVSRKELEDARVEAYAKGQEHGREEARRQLQEAGEADQQRLRERIDALSASLDALRLQPDKIHEPLKRLALHLAEQLVLGELSQSPQAIERLVRRCVDELGSAAQAPVRIELHPQDLALLQPWLAGPSGDEAASGEAAKAAPPWQLVPDEGLRPGSVRASANDAVVTDLIEHRLDVMVRQLLLDANRSAQQSAFRPERLAARRAEVDAVLDAQPRMADLPRQSRFSPVVEAEPAVAEATQPAAESAAEPQDTPAPQGDAPQAEDGGPA